MIKYASYGYVLISVLVFIQVFSIISMFALVYVFDSIKRNNHQWIGYVYRLKGHEILRQLETKIESDQAICLLPTIPAPLLAHKPISWWKLHTCSDNVSQIRYYYAIEFLGNDPCGEMGKNVMNQPLMARFYRITLYLPPDTLQGAKYIIQSSVALPAVQTSVCKGKLHTINPGRQAWREIDV